MKPARKAKANSPRTTRKDPQQERTDQDAEGRGHSQALFILGIIVVDPVHFPLELLAGFRGRFDMINVSVNDIFDEGKKDGPGEEKTPDFDVGERGSLLSPPQQTCGVQDEHTDRHGDMGTGEAVQQLIVKQLNGHVFVADKLFFDGFHWFN
jgi:hypothetical protein